MTGSRKPEYGICGACGRSRHLRANGTVGAHQYMTPYGHRTSTTCAGVGTLPRKETPMPQRNRYATRAELAELVATEHTSAADVAVVLDGLAEFGAPVDALVKILVDADTDKPVYRELEQGKPHMIPAPQPVNTCESAEDAARRYGRQLVEANNLLDRAGTLITNVDNGTTGAQQTAFWRESAEKWRERFLAARSPHDPEDKDR